MATMDEKLPFLYVVEKGDEIRISPTSEIAGKKKGLRAWIPSFPSVLVHSVLILLYTIVTFTVLQVHSVGAGQTLFTSSVSSDFPSARVEHGDHRSTIKHSSEPHSSRPVPSSSHPITATSHPHNAINNLTLLTIPQAINLYDSSKYAGPPTDPSIDAAWDKLLEPIHIRVSDAELKRNNRTSVSLTEGGGSIAWLGVYHEIHCVKLLRQWKYKEHYFPNISPEMAFDLESHTDHCLDRMLSSFMCHPDTSSLVTFFWSPTKPKPVVDGTKTLHECVNWDALVGSMEGRRVSEGEVGRLANPLATVGKD